jgi:hypothetical protein
MITIDVLKAMSKPAEFKAALKDKPMLNKANFAIFLVDYKFGTIKFTSTLLFKKEGEAKAAMKSIKKEKFHKMSKLSFGTFIKTNANEWIFEIRGGGAALDIVGVKANDLFSPVKINIKVQQGTPDPDMQPDAADLAEPEEADDTTPENNTDKTDVENDDTNTDDAPVKVKLKTLAAEIRAIVDIISDKSKRTPELIEKLKKSALNFYQAFNDANIIIRTLFQKSYKFVSDLLIQLKLEPTPTPPTPTPPTPTPEPNKATPEQETIFTESTTKIKELFLKMGITLAI